MTESKPPLSAPEKVFPERVWIGPTSASRLFDGCGSEALVAFNEPPEKIKEISWPYVPEAKLKEAKAEIAKMNSVNIFLASDMLDAAGKRDEFKAEADKLPVTTALLHEIMRAGTTQDGNTIEASLAYEALAYLAGERTIDDLKRIKALPADFAQPADKEKP